MTLIEAKDPYQPILLGRAGENLVRTVVFDISGWIDEHGEGEPLLLAQRPRDESPYPVSTYEEDGKVYWPVKAEA